MQPVRYPCFVQKGFIARSRPKGEQCAKGRKDENGERRVEKLWGGERDEGTSGDRERMKERERVSERASE
jgi:hypothetical protein